MAAILNFQGAMNVCNFLRKNRSNYENFSDFAKKTPKYDRTDLMRLWIYSNCCHLEKDIQVELVEAHFRK